jgi:hypothetical protein
MAVLCLNSPRSTSVTCRITFLSTVVVDCESSKTSLFDHHRKSVNRNDPCYNSPAAAAALSVRDCRGTALQAGAAGRHAKSLGPSKSTPRPPPSTPVRPGGRSRVAADGTRSRVGADGTARLPIASRVLPRTRRRRILRPVAGPRRRHAWAQRVNPACLAEVWPSARRRTPDAPVGPTSCVAFAHRHRHAHTARPPRHRLPGR